MAVDEGKFVARFYTRARKFPRLLGVTPHGRPLPGGPYTITQAIAAVATLFLLSKTTFLWATGGLITTAAVGLAVVGGVVYLVGQIPAGTYNPLWFLAGLITLASSPAAGRTRGATIRPPRPRRLNGTCLIDLHEDDAPDRHLPEVEVPAEEEKPRAAEPLQHSEESLPGPQHHTGAPTGVGELLALAVQNRSTR